jgi:Uma2 family endonuclease
VIPELSFESTRGMSQSEFAPWAQSRLGWDPNRYELLNGRVIMTPPAGYPHGSVESRVVRVLSSFASARDLGEVLGSSQGLELPSGATVAPDASFVAKERWTSMTAPAHGAFLRVVPDLAVEILAPSTATHDRGEKKAIYERDGVREYWLIDPRARTVTVFIANEGRFDVGTEHAEADRFRATVLPGLEIVVADLFPAP